MSKVSTLNHLPFEPGCGDNSFPDQAVAGFEQDMDSILTVKTPELYTSFNEPDNMISSLSSEFLHSVYEAYYEALSKNNVYPPWTIAFQLPPNLMLNQCPN